MRYYLLIKHRVKEYSYWRSEFDTQLQWRQALGEIKFQVFTEIEDENDVTILSEWNSLEEARKFIADPQLSEVMQVAGVLEQPTVCILRKE